MIISKNIVGLINSSKNKLNSKIILIFHPNPNARIMFIQIFIQ